MQVSDGFQLYCELEKAGNMVRIKTYLISWDGRTSQRIVLALAASSIVLSETIHGTVEVFAGEPRGTLQNLTFDEAEEMLAVAIRSNYPRRQRPADSDHASALRELVGNLPRCEECNGPGARLGVSLKRQEDVVLCATCDPEMEWAHQDVTYEKAVGRALRALTGLP